MTNVSTPGRLFRQQQQKNGENIDKVEKESVLLRGAKDAHGANTPGNKEEKGCARVCSLSK